MRRTEVLQAIRQMKFEEDYERSRRRRISRAEAASILGMSEPTFQRWRDRFEGEGVVAKVLSIGLVERIYFQCSAGKC